MMSPITCLLLLYLPGQAPQTPHEKPKFDPEYAAWGARLPAGDPAKDPESWTFTGRTAHGFVAAVAKDGITLYWPARKIVQSWHNPETGVQLRMREETFPAIPPRKFRFGEVLAAGGYDKTVSAENTYRITDVRVGDLVDLVYDRRKGVDICRTINILRRPGGLVPPAPGEKPNEFRTHADGANAHQAWEENRIPYPRKFWPVYRGQDGRFYAAPYPSESTQIVPIEPRSTPQKKLADPSPR